MGRGQGIFFASNKDFPFFAPKFLLPLVFGLLHKKSKNHPKGYFYFFEKGLWNICLCNVFFTLPDRCMKVMAKDGRDV